MTVALVLYEDSRGESGEFGPHELLMAMLADQVGASYWLIRKKVESAPMNGIANLLAALTSLDRFRHLAPHGAPVVAMIDNDKVRQHLGLPTSASAADVGTAIRQRCDQPSRLTIVLLEENVESLVAAKARCDGSVEPSKGINERDLALLPVARDGARRPIRDCIRKEMPSIDPALTFLAPLV